MESRQLGNWPEPQGYQRIIRIQDNQVIWKEYNGSWSDFLIDMMINFVVLSLVSAFILSPLSFLISRVLHVKFSKCLGIAAVLLSGILSALMISTVTDQYNLRRR